MHARAGFVRSVTLIALVGGAIVAAVPLASHGDSPPWAPAHGKRQQGDPYVGFTGKKWDKHYGVINGRCNREAVGAEVGKGEKRQIAILVAAAAGAATGAKIGTNIDQTDRACIGHTLELVGDKKSVTWTSANQRRTYRLTPLRGFAEQGMNCREFDFRVTTDGGKQTSRLKACPGGDGAWRLVG